MLRDIYDLDVNASPRSRVGVAMNTTATVPGCEV